MATMNRVKIISFSVFRAKFALFLGFVAGCIYSFGGLIIDVLVSAGQLSPEKFETPGLSVGTLLAMGALVGMPIIAAIGGFVIGFIEAIVYNLYVRWFKPFEIAFWE